MLERHVFINGQNPSQTLRVVVVPILNWTAEISFREYPQIHEVLLKLRKFVDAI